MPSRLRLTLRILLLLLLLPLPTGAAQGRCGVERWAVKTGTDRDADLVDLSVHHKTRIAAMRSWAAPHVLPARKRVRLHETQVWVLDAPLTAFKIEDDPNTGRFRLPLGARRRVGKQIIAEIPAPHCVKEESPFFEDIQRSRAKFDANLTATGTFQTVKIPARVIGVGFFDFHHGQRGVAPNAVELHPVLDIIFNP